MSHNAPKEYLGEVRRQYEAMPYPFRDPAKERDAFYMSESYSMTALSHFGWAGKRDLRDGVRILVAGEGTGDIAIFFAEQWRDTNAEIVAIDISSTSIGIAQARMKKRGLTNVTHRHMSILDVPTAGLGEFDIIESGGVLHHLADPDAGLKALASVLKEDGLMALMVYGQHGRAGVYLVQDLLRRMIPAEASHEMQLAMARAFLNRMPSSHLFAQHHGRFADEINWPDGSGIFDLLLHSTDRAYNVPQIYAWMDTAGLGLVSFYDEFLSDIYYQPEVYTQDPLLLASFADKTARERHAIAELMNGDMHKHHFYAAKQPKIPAAFADDMVISWGVVLSLVPQWVSIMQQALASVAIGQTVQEPDLGRGGAPRMHLTKSVHTEALLGMIDDEKSIGRIVGKRVEKTNAPPSQVRADLEQLYRELFTNKRVFLRHKSIPPYITAAGIVHRLKTISEIA